MKTITLVIATILSTGAFLSAATNGNNEKTAEEKRRENADFIRSEIVSKMETKDKNTSIKYFSRCPSGMNYKLSENSSLDDENIYGKIVDWNGCVPVDVCFFHVNVAADIAEVSANENTTYTAVSGWNRLQNDLVKK